MSLFRAVEKSKGFSIMGITETFRHVISSISLRQYSQYVELIHNIILQRHLRMLFRERAIHNVLEVGDKF